MNMNKCETCGQYNFEGATLQVEDISARVERVVKLEYFKEVPEGTKALNISTIQRTSMLKSMTETKSNQDYATEAYNERIVPVLKKLIDNGFELIGEVSPPATMKLAITELSVPQSVFHYVLAKDDGTLESQLSKLGLSKLLNPHLTDTVAVDGPTWFDVA